MVLFTNFIDQHDQQHGSGSHKTTTP